MDTSILEDLGLSKGEIKVYLVLLEKGSSKVGIVIEKSGMASSAVHNSINTLIEKGLISYVKKGKIKYYQSITPKQLVSFFNDKKKRLLEILPELEIKQAFATEKEESEIFKGMNGVIAMLNLLISDTKKRDEYLFFAIDVEQKNDEIQKFMRRYDVKRKENELIIKGLAHNNLKNYFVQRKMLKMKYVTFPIPSNISICNNKVAFFSWSEKPIGYLIESKQISKMYKVYFNQIWNKK